VMPGGFTPVVAPSPGFVAPTTGDPSAPPQSFGAAPLGAAAGPLDVPPPPPPPPPAKNSPLVELKKQWAETSLPKKIILALLPVGFVMVILAFGEDGPEAPAKKAKPAASASAVAAASGSSNADDDEPPAPKPKKTPKVVVPPTVNASASTTASADKAAPPGPAPTKSPATADSTRTPEREAADAVAAKNWAEAAKLYGALAKEHPEDPAYAEAARILRAKARREKGERDKGDEKEDQPKGDEKDDGDKPKRKPKDE